MQCGLLFKARTVLQTFKRATGCSPGPEALFLLAARASGAGDAKPIEQDRGGCGEGREQGQSCRADINLSLSRWVWMVKMIVDRMAHASAGNPCQHRATGDAAKCGQIC